MELGEVPSRGDPAKRGHQSCSGNLVNAQKLYISISCEDYFGGSIGLRIHCPADERRL